MIVLKFKDSGSAVGSVSEEEFQFLVDQLEEESEEDTDYYVTPPTVELLEGKGGSEHLIGVLKAALGGSEGVELSWSRE